MADSQNIPIIGVVGGIGSGKSFFAQTLAKQKNLVIVDGDAVGHALLLRPEIRDQIRDRFGDSVIAADCSINRRALGRLVFGTTPEQVQAKTDLESIVHPPLTAELQRQITEAQAAGHADAIILDAAILLEAGWRKFCNAVVMIDTPFEVRWQRVQATRGWSLAEFQAREASQMSIADKRAAADYVVRNVGPEDEVAKRCLQVWNQIMDGTP
jgi:dephospho-CoA kinase